MGPIPEMESKLVVICTCTVNLQNRVEKYYDQKYDGIRDHERLLKRYNTWWMDF